MKIINQNMQKFLANNFIDAKVKYIDKGSLKGCWRIENPQTDWYFNTKLQQKFQDLGFKDFNGAKLTRHSGNGGVFQIFVKYDKSVIIK